VRASQGKLGWSLNKGKTDNKGQAKLDMLAGLDAEFCFHLENEAAEFSTNGFSEANICDFGLSLKGSEIHGTDSYLVRVNERYTNAFVQMTDARDYMKEVVGADMHEAKVLVGKIANKFPNAMAPCLDFPNWKMLLLDEGLNVAIHALGGLLPADLPGIPLAVSGTQTTVFGINTLHPDIVLPKDSVYSRGVPTHEYGHYAMCNLIYDNGGTGSGMKEFGSAWTEVVRRSIDKDRSGCESCGIAEGWADFFASQVVGGTNYFSIGKGGVHTQVRPGRFDTLDPTKIIPISSTGGTAGPYYPVSLYNHEEPDGGVPLASARGVETSTVWLDHVVDQTYYEDFRTPSMFYCNPYESVCMDDNIGGKRNVAFGPVSASGFIGEKTFNREVAKFATLLHDLFDGQPLNTSASKPGNGSAWFPSAELSGQGVFDVQATQTKTKDLFSFWFSSGHQSDESVALSGATLKSIISRWAETTTPKLHNKEFYIAMSKAMQDSGVADAEICKVFALHSTDGLCPSYLPVAANIIPGPPSLRGKLTPDQYSPNILWTFESTAPFAQQFGYEIKNLTDGNTVAIGTLPFATGEQTMPTGGLPYDKEISAELWVINGAHISQRSEYRLTTPPQSPLAAVSVQPGRSIVYWGHSQASSYAIELFQNGRWEIVRNLKDDGAGIYSHTLWGLPGVEHKVRVVGIGRYGDRGYPGVEAIFTPIPPKDVFVSAFSGNDAYADAGTQAHPFKTLDAAWTRIVLGRTCPLVGGTPQECEALTSDWMAVKLSLSGGSYTTSTVWETSDPLHLTYIKGGHVDGSWAESTQSTSIKPASASVTIPSCGGGQTQHTSFAVREGAALMLERVQVQPDAVATDDCQSVVASYGSNVQVIRSTVSLAGPTTNSTCRTGISLYDWANGSDMEPSASLGMLEIRDFSQVTAARNENAPAGTYMGVCGQQIASISIADSTISGLTSALPGSEENVIGLMSVLVDDVVIARSTIASVLDDYGFVAGGTQMALAALGPRSLFAHNSLIRTGRGPDSMAFMLYPDEEGIVKLYYITAAVGDNWGLKGDPLQGEVAVGSIAAQPKRLTIANSVLAYAGGRSPDMTVLDVDGIGVPAKQYIRGNAFSLELNDEASWSTMRCAAENFAYKWDWDDWEFGDQPLTMVCALPPKAMRYDIGNNQALSDSPCDEWSTGTCEDKQASDGPFSYQVAQFATNGTSLLSGGALRCNGVDLRNEPDWDTIRRDRGNNSRLTDFDTNHPFFSVGARHEPCTDDDWDVVFFPN
jgi:hypothetical protein